MCIKLYVNFIMHIKRADNPGPNVYRLPSTLAQKGVSLAKKIDSTFESGSPGPADYQAVALNSYKGKAPKFTLAKQFENPLTANQMNDSIPSPQTYNPSLNFKYNRSPGYSFGMRRPDKFPPLVVCGDQKKKNKQN